MTNFKKHMAISAVLALFFIGFSVTGCKKEVKISEKSKQLFGTAWVYDAEATRTEVLTKSGEATGIKNLKDIKLQGDVKKMAEALTAKSIFFAADKQGRGIGYIQTTGKGILKSEISGWLTWNQDETSFTLTPTDKKHQPSTYKVVEISPNKLLILNDASKTNTPEIFKR